VTKQKRMTKHEQRLATLIRKDGVEAVKKFLADARRKAAKEQGWRASELAASIAGDHADVDRIAARVGASKSGTTTQAAETAPAAAEPQTARKPKAPKAEKPGGTEEEIARKAIEEANAGGPAAVAEFIAKGAKAQKAADAAVAAATPKPAAKISRKAPAAKAPKQPRERKGRTRGVARKGGSDWRPGQPRYTDKKRSGATWELYPLGDGVCRARIASKGPIPEGAAWGVLCVEHGHVEFREKLHASGKQPCPECAKIDAGKAPRIGAAEASTNGKPASRKAPRKGAAAGKGATETSRKGKGRATAAGAK
jgi:hypothetical protein